MSTELFLGIDLGTSGVRACAIDAAGSVAASVAVEMPPPRRNGAAVTQDPAVWWQSVLRALQRLGRDLDLRRIGRLAVDGTSGTLLLADAGGHPLMPALMYNDASAAAEAQHVAAVAPPESGAHGASSALAKLLYLLARGGTVRHALHQADWIAGRLAGRLGVTDENNALKLGYDPVARCWPSWLDALSVPRTLLPEVRVPGDLIGQIEPALAETLGFSPELEIRAGTTDGVAAFIATRASETGDAVTSLGSTLVLKLLSDRPVFAPQFGVYSHRLGERWLAGGASNSGGAALLMHFSAERIAELTPRLDPGRPTGLSYYPLPARGERFPIHDPELAPRVTPRPAEDALFLQGLFEGIAGIEAQGYERLAELGAPALRRVLTVGGGARNAAWTRLRAQRLGVPVMVAQETEAAYGTALIARSGGPSP